MTRSPEAADRSGRWLGSMAALLGRAQRAVRSVIVPIGDVAAAVPKGHRLIDIGCGEGLVLERVLARADEIVGVDLDARKIAFARSRLAAAAHVRLHHGDAFAFLAAQRDASVSTVLLVDTLSALQVRAQDRLLEETVRVLEPGGTLVLKLMDASPRWKAALSRALSTLVCAGFRMSLSDGQRFTYRSSAELLELLVAAGTSVEVRHLHAERHHPLPHVLLLARRMGAPRRSPDAAARRSLS